MPTVTKTPANHPAGGLQHVDIRNDGPDQVVVSGANGRVIVTVGATVRYLPAGHDIEFSANGLADVVFTDGPHRSVGLA